MRRRSPSTGQSPSAGSDRRVRRSYSSQSVERDRGPTQPVDKPTGRFVCYLGCLNDGGVTLSARNADRARDTREHILEAAAVAFAEQGYEGTSLNTLLRESGISKGALYFHFSSKEALAVAVVDYLRARWLASTSAAAETGASGLEKMRMMASGSTQAYHEMPGYRALGKLCWHLVAVRPDLAPQLRATFGAWTDAIESVIRQAQAEGDLRPDVDTKGLAEIIMATFTGMQEVSELMSGGDDLDARVETFVGMMVGLLTPAGAARREWQR